MATEKKQKDFSIDSIDSSSASPQLPTEEYNRLIAALIGVMISNTFSLATKTTTLTLLKRNKCSIARS
jgi:hypothetical protein